MADCFQKPESGMLSKQNNKEKLGQEMKRSDRVGK